MILRGYTARDYEALNSWLEARGMNHWDKKSVPEIGYVTCKEDRPIAIGFLRMVEGNSAMIDGLCTDPSAPSADRNKAIDLVVHELISTAESLKLSGIVAFSDDPNTLDRSGRFGFKRSNEKVMISLRLGD